MQSSNIFSTDYGSCVRFSRVRSIAKYKEIKHVKVGKIKHVKIYLLIFPTAYTLQSIVSLTDTAKEAHLVTILLNFAVNLFTVCFITELAVRGVSSIRRRYAPVASLAAVRWRQPPRPVPN